MHYALCIINHSLEYLRHQRLCLVGCLLHFFVRGGLGRVAYAHVRYYAHAEYAYAAVACYYYLGYCAHTHRVGSHRMVCAVFRRSLIAWSLHTYVGAVYQSYAFLRCYTVGGGNQLMVVRLVHIGKARTGGYVLAPQRVLGEEIDVVGDDHQVAYAEILVGSARSVTYEESPDAQLIHHAYGECHLLHGVTLVVMEASLHGQYLLAAQCADDEASVMSLHR